MDTTILTNNGIDINKGLELLGDMDMYNETLGDFLDESETRIPFEIENPDSEKTYVNGLFTESFFLTCLPAFVYNIIGSTTINNKLINNNANL